MALFAHKEHGTLHPKTAELLETIAQRVEKNGIDAWFDLDATELLGKDAVHYHKVSDTLDVWFDSGVTHAAVLEQRDELQFPADFYLEGSDQHRGWFQSSLLTSVAMHGVAPYKSVLTHGFAVDAHGMKMSKSKGNVVAPQQVVSTLGADILRLWVASADYSAEMAVSDEILKRTADAYRRMRNTARFLLANLHGFDPALHCVAPDKMLALDAWAVERARQLQDEVRAAYESCEFHLIYHKVHNFCSVDLGGFYLDIIKDRQYTTQANSIARRSAQTAMYHIIEAMVRWLAPILSFTAEELWHFIPGQRGTSVLLASWHELPVPTTSDINWVDIIAVRDEVKKELEKLRVVGGIGSSLDAEVDVYCDDVLGGMLGKLEDELRFVFITSYARVHSLQQRPADAVATSEGLWVKVTPSAHKKCIRCWHHREDVGTHAVHPPRRDAQVPQAQEWPEICGRCVDNVSGAGEQRGYA